MTRIFIQYTFCVRLNYTTSKMEVNPFGILHQFSRIVESRHAELDRVIISYI